MSKTDNFFRYENANDSSGFLLWQCHNLWQREIKKKLKSYDLTHVQFVILASAYWLSQKGYEITQVNIARHAKSDVMMTSSVLRSLEKKKLLFRKEKENDTRAKSVTVTEMGKSRLKEAIKAVEDFDEIFFSNLKDKALFNKELLNLLAD